MIFQSRFYSHLLFIILFVSQYCVATPDEKLEEEYRSFTRRVAPSSKSPMNKLLHDMVNMLIRHRDTSNPQDSIRGTYPMSLGKSKPKPGCYGCIQPLDLTLMQEVW